MRDCKTLLVVDDTPENIDLLSTLLRDDYKIKAATNGERALAIARKTPAPDLILLDIMMPGIDGYEVCRQLKSSPSTAAIPIIFVTAMEAEQNEEKGLELGAVDYITKPISPSITKARIKTHLALHEQKQMLEIKVQEETEKRVKQERLLLRQSRLAAMGEMMSSITHQWAQPLNAISMTNASLQISLSMGTLQNEELEKQLEQIAKTVTFMHETMLDFKYYFKPDKQMQRFSVREEVTTIVSMLRPLLNTEEISLEIAVDDDATGFGSPSEFKQVLLNLINNAKDAIVTRAQQEHIQGKITITGESLGTDTLLRICDNGSGIPEEIINTIFDDYFTTKDEKGTGIGLSMSKMIIEEQMHGSITASNTGDGAEFILKFPSSGANKE